METAEIILKYLQVILGWPVVALILGVIFLKWFKDPISDFFRRVVRGEAYGVKIEASSPSEQRKEVKEIPQPQTYDQIEKYIKDHPKEVIKEYLRLLNGYWFERAFNIIYGTQMDLLEYLSTKGTKGENYINLVSFYNEFVKRSGLASTQMADYLGFLKDMRFIEFVEENKTWSVKITAYGVDFLSYIKGQYPSSYRYRAF